MRVIIVLNLVYLFVQVKSIDPDAHVSFALVFPKETHRRLRRTVELSPSAYTEEEKKAMLDAHNDYRRITNPSAANMNLLTWNDQLADSVQTWTEQCIWDHGQVEFEDQQYSPMGQNLWRGGNKVSLSAVIAWMNEDKYYNYTENACQPNKACGHYTQVLWDTTKEMGCGYHSCEDGSTIVGCNYGPAGNYNRQPYIAGPRCSLCSEPGFCYDGLCSQQCYDESVVNGTCECSFECQHCGVLNETDCTCACKPGWNGDQCQEPCEDISSRCNNGWYRAQCESYSYVKKGCPAMCSACELLTDENTYDCPCDGKICKNGGQLDTGSCICECPDGFAGDVCEYVVTSTVSTSVCDGRTCQNGGYLTVETCTCACSDGYTGSVCENIVTTQASTTQATTTQASPRATTRSSTQAATTQTSTQASTRATTRASTQASTTEASTTQATTSSSSRASTQDSTTQPSTQASTTQALTTQPSTIQTSTTQPSTIQPSTTQPSTTQPSTTQPSTTQPSTTEPSIQASTIQPSTTQPSTTQPSIQASTQESTQTSTRASVQASNQASTQTSNQASTQALTQTSNQASMQASTQALTQASTHASTKASTNKDLTQASTKGSIQASIRASTQASTIASVQASIQSSTQAITQWSTHPLVTVSNDIDSRETITTTEEQNKINMTTAICQLTCSKRFVADISTCKCIKKDEEPPVGSANICMSSPVYVIIITTISLLLSHE